jgi:predicted RNA binding protein YcfA (HicA-like mRNA interferase family)
MSRMKTIKAAMMINFLRSLGFEQTRQKGSHKFFRHSDGRTATVPDHKGEDLGRGLTNKILNDAEVSRETFINWCKNG